MGSVRRVVASTVADLLGISELRARALLGPKGPLAEHVLERPNPHHYTGPKMRVVPLDVVMAWADEHGETLTRWQSQRERSHASRDRASAARERAEEEPVAARPVQTVARVRVVELAEGEEPPALALKGRQNPAGRS